jgi:hypothetical protein
MFIALAELMEWVRSSPPAESSRLGGPCGHLVCCHMFIRHGHARRPLLFWRLLVSRSFHILLTASAHENAQRHRQLSVTVKMELVKQSD